LNNHFWMYRNTFKGLYRQDYLKKVEGLNVLLISYFIIQRILVEVKLYIHVWSITIKSFTIKMLWRCFYLKKSFLINTCVDLHTEKPYVPYQTMLEMMVNSNSSSSNIYEFVDDNSNPYRSVVMDAMRMNKNYSGESSLNILLYKEPNLYATRFFKTFKRSWWTIVGWVYNS